jgi:hypothetical protein
MDCTCVHNELDSFAQDDCIYDCIPPVDYNGNFLIPVMKLDHDYFIENTVVAPKCLIVHTTNQPNYFDYDLQDYMCSIFEQHFSFQDQRKLVLLNSHE